MDISSVPSAARTDALSNTLVAVAPRANASIEAREAPLSGHRYVAVRLLAPVRAGEELVLDYGKNYPRHLFANSQRRPAPLAGKRKTSEAADAAEAEGAL